MAAVCCGSGTEEKSAVIQLISLNILLLTVGLESGSTFSQPNGLPVNPQELILL